MWKEISWKHIFQFIFDIIDFELNVNIRFYIFKKRASSADQIWIQLCFFVSKIKFLYFQEAVPRFWFACDILTDLVFVLDIAVQLRTGYLEQGLMVSIF